MKALVLGGGSLKGAWQVGAIQAILETGFQPDMIYGISAGGLNAAFMVNEAGRQMTSEKKIDWDLVNKRLINFWLENINQPSDIGFVRSKWTLGLDTILSRFDGLLDTNPLHEKLKRYIDLTTLRRSPVKLKVGTVNINTGEMYYADPSEQYFLDYLRASSSLPIIMPVIQIGGDHRQAFLDGGIREVVPLRQAILDGATEIYAVATHPKHRKMEPINYRSFFSLIERVKDISVNQFENSDIEWAENYNESLVEIAGFKLAKQIKLTVIRPEEPVNIHLTQFTKDDIRQVIKDGFTFAYTQLYQKK